MRTTTGAVAPTTAPELASPEAANPLARPWVGPYGGVPPFDEVRVVHFEPALEQAMREYLEEVERIAADPATPTFENTIAALEATGRALSRVAAVYGVWSGGMSDAEFQALERRMAPRLAELSDRVRQNAALYRRIEAVYEARENAGLTPEQQRLAWFYHNTFVRSGARLDAAGKRRVAEINQRLAALFTSFAQNVLADETDLYLVLESEEELAGLPEALRDAAAAAGAQRGLTGRWVIANTRSAIESFLASSTRRDLRERAWRMFASRGDNGGAHDNNGIVAEILALRAERATLLGYATHAHWRLEDTMAKTPERAQELMQAVWTQAVARVREEVADMQAIAEREGAEITSLAPWDYRFYAEKVRKAKYDLDEGEIEPYLQLDQLREGMFWVAGELFGLRFTPAADVPVYHLDVRVWEVTEAATGRHVGLWYLDPYARTGKRSGAWMSSYRRQEKFERPVTTIVSNNSNFTPGKPGEPVLVSWDDATTLFHEFGHALHGLMSDVSYPSLSGTSVPRDYVEFPSQLLEHWLSTPEVLQRFARHHRSGEPIPESLVRRIERASTFNEGFATVEYLACALMDMALHLAGDRPVDPGAFERATLADLGMPPEVGMRHRTPHFLHVFSSDAYSAAYYSYLWSDVLTADAFDAFIEAGSPFDREVARRLARVLSLGNTLDPAESYRAFRGRDPRVESLMRKRGFTAAGPGGASR